MNIRNTPQLNNMNTNNPTPIPMTAPMTLDTLRDLSDALMLRQTQANQRESETLLDDVQAFMLKARQAGQYLDKPADRRACQSLINYWSGLLYEHKREVGELSLLQFDERLAPELSAEPCPYLGLHPFGAGSSAFYFGRDKLVQDMLNTLRTQRMVCIAGSSGSGKSSAALGGLLPALQANALADSSLKDSAAWSLVTLTPGASPLRALAVALGMDADSDADALAKRFTQAEAEPITPITPFTPMLLVVDQFEELFTLCSDGAQRAAFATTLAHIYECGHYLVLTVRVDFVEAALSLAPLTERLEAARINMRPLSGDELRAAIERPAERVGLKIEGRVVDDLISEIRNEPAGLPLLQFTLRKLWENRRCNRITWDIYQKVGSPHLALERSADQFYNSLSPQDKEAMRRILLKLIRPPDDTSATYEPMSLRLTRAQLFQDNVSKDRVSQMLRRLVDQERLLRETPGQTDGDTHIEVAHEALARNWPRLAEWLKDERVSVRQMQHHQRMRRALVSSLVVAAVLATLALWALWERGQANAFARIKQRVADSYAAVDVMAANPAQALRKAVEANLDAPVLFETEDALRQTVLGFGGRQIVMTHTHPVVSAVYVNAGRRVATASGSEIVIWDAATGSKIKTLLAAAELQSLAATADGGLFVSIDVSGTVAVWSAQTYAQMHAVQLADELLDSAQFLPPDNAEVVILSQMGHVYRWRYKDSTQQPMLIPLASKVYPPMAVAPNGVLAAKTDPAHVVLWNLNTATPTPSMTLTLAHSEATALAFSRDSQQIGIGRDDGAAEVWQVGQPQQTQPRKIREWSAHRLGITILAFSSDGKKLATVGGNFLTVWEIESGSQLGNPRQHTQAIRNVVFSTDGGALLTSSDDGRANIWTDHLMYEQAIYVEAEPFVRSAWFAGEYSWVVLATPGRIEVVDAISGALLSKIQANDLDSSHATPFLGASGRGDTITSYGSSGFATWRVADTTRPVCTAPLALFNQPVQFAEVSDDGSRIALVIEGGALIVSDTSTCTLLSGFPITPSIPLRAVAFSPDASQIIGVTGEQSVLVWDVKNLTTPISFSVDGNLAFAAVSPDNKRIAVATDNVVAVIDTLSKRTQFMLVGHTRSITRVRYSPDGQRLLTASEDGTARLWLAQQGQLASVLRGHSALIQDARFSADGHKVITAGFDGASRVYWVKQPDVLALARQRLKDANLP